MRSQRVVIVVLLLALGVVACGSDDVASTSSTAAVATTTPSTVPAPSTTVAVTSATAGTTSTTMAPTTTVPLSPPVAGWKRLAVDSAGFGEVTITDGATLAGRVVVGGCRRDADIIASDRVPLPLWWSDDLETWHRGDGGGAVCVTQVEATGVGFFAVGNGAQLWSPDGAAWVAVELHEAFGLEYPGQLGYVQAVFAVPDGDRVTLLYARAAEAESTIATLVTTTDGETWTAGPADSAALFDSSGVADVIPGGDGLLAVGSSPGGEFVPTAAVFTSADGLSWRRLTPRDAEFNDKIMAAITETAFGYVAVGGDFFTTGLMTAWISADGLTWRRSPHPEETVDPSVAFMTAEAVTLGNGVVWVAGHDYDARRGGDALPAMWTSANAIDWQRIPFPEQDSIVPFAVIETGDLLLATWPPPRSEVAAPVQLFVPEP